MTERTNIIKSDDEQFPLLKVEGKVNPLKHPMDGFGEGDVINRTMSIPLNMDWNINWPKKRCWYKRWPELLTACWMSTTLFSIGFLSFYVFSLLCASGIISQPPIFISLGANNSKTGSEVMYHHVIPRGGSLHFQLYHDYLTSMAVKYPNLKFTVYFLVDDSLQNIYVPRHGSYYNSFSYVTNIMQWVNNLDYSTKTDMQLFLRKHTNFNIVIMTVSNFMGMTPLKYKWRFIPMSYLSFYARTFSVWQHGGIGLDLVTFNNKHNNHDRLDRQITAILKLHNDGYKLEDYKQTFYQLEHEEETELTYFFYSLLTQMMTEAKSIYNRTCSQFLESYPEANKPLTRTHRNKREILDTNTTNLIVAADGNTNSTNEFVLLNATEANMGVENQTSPSLIVSENVSTTVETAEPLNKLNKTDDILDMNLLNSTSSDKPIEVKKAVIFFDFSLLSDDLFKPPTTSLTSKMSKSFYDISPKVDNSEKFLTIEAYGSFIAASSAQHPFLRHVLNAGVQRMSPRFAIENVLYGQCSSMFKNDLFCNSIHII